MQRTELNEEMNLKWLLTLEENPGNRLYLQGTSPISPLKMFKMHKSVFSAQEIKHLIVN